MKLSLRCNLLEKCAIFDTRNYQQKPKSKSGWKIHVCQKLARVNQSQHKHRDEKLLPQKLLPPLSWSPNPSLENSPKSSFCFIDSFCLPPDTRAKCPSLAEATSGSLSSFAPISRNTRAPNLCEIGRPSKKPLAAHYDDWALLTSRLIACCKLAPNKARTSKALRAHLTKISRFAARVALFWQLNWGAFLVLFRFVCCTLFHASLLRNKRARQKTAATQAPLEPKLDSQTQIWKLNLICLFVCKSQLQVESCKCKTQMHKTRQIRVQNPNCGSQVTFALQSVSQCLLLSCFLFESQICD